MKIDRAHMSLLCPTNLTLHLVSCIDRQPSVVYVLDPCHIDKHFPAGDESAFEPGELRTKELFGGRCIFLTDGLLQGSEGVIADRVDAETGERPLAFKSGNFEGFRDRAKLFPVKVNRDALDVYL